MQNFLMNLISLSFVHKFPISCKRMLQNSFATFMVSPGGVYLYHRTTFFMLFPFPIYCAIRTTAYSFSALLLKSALILFVWTRVVKVFYGGVRSVGRIPGMTGAYST